MLENNIKIHVGFQMFPVFCVTFIYHLECFCQVFLPNDMTWYDVAPVPAGKFFSANTSSWSRRTVHMGEFPRPFSVLWCWNRQAVIVIGCWWPCILKGEAAKGSKFHAGVLSWWFDSCLGEFQWILITWFFWQWINRWPQSWKVEGVQLVQLQPPWKSIWSHDVYHLVSAKNAAACNQEIASSTGSDLRRFGK